MNNRKFYLLQLVLLISDLFLINASFCVAYLLFVAPNESRSGHINLSVLFLFNIIWIASATLFRLYSYKTLQHIETIYRSTWRAFVVHLLLFVSIYFFFHEVGFNYRFIFSCYAFIIALTILNRLLLTYITEFVFKKLAAKRKVIILGYNECGKKLASYFDSNSSFYQLEGVFGYKNDKDNTSLYTGSLEECMDFADEHHVTDIYSTILPEQDERIKFLQNVAENRGRRMLFVIGTQQLTPRATYHRMDFIKDMPVLSLRVEPLLDEGNRLRKRIFDILFSFFIIIIILSWLTPVVAILIKLSSKGPVFFKQQRLGRDNQPFWCYKFRSMEVNESADELQATKNDSRITPIGAFLRKSSLDELPQFFNTLIGNMSIVGPRPHMLKHNKEYSAVINKYLIRHLLKPGITGWAQVNGYRGETSDLSLMRKRVEYDIEYMENWSLMLDIKIIFMTIINILKGEQAAY